MATAQQNALNSDQYGLPKPFGNTGGPGIVNTLNQSLGFTPPPAPIPTSMANSNEPGSLSGVIGGMSRGTSGGSSEATSGPTPPPTTPPPQGALPGTSFQQNLGAIGAASQLGTPEEQALRENLQQAGLYYGNKGAAPLGSFNIGGAAQGFQQAQASLLNSQVAAAQPQFQDIQAQRAAALQGTEAQAGYTAPQPYGITSTPYSPGTNSFGTLPGGANGAVGAGVVQGQIQAGQTGAMNQAILGKVTPMVQNLNSLIQQEGINPSDTTFVNQLNQWARGTLSDSAIPKFQGQLNDIVSSLSGILGVPSSATSDFRTQLAGAIVNGLQSGKSVADSVNYFVQQAQQANQGYLSGASGATSSGTPAPGTTTAGGYGFHMENGVWVPN